MALDSRIAFFKKNAFLAMYLFVVLFSLQFHEAPTIVDLKMFHTECKRTLCEHSLQLYAKYYQTNLL